VTLLHAPSLASVTAWTAARRAEAVERLLPWLLARLLEPAARGAPAGGPGLVRRYVLGPSPRVRDRRSGRDTGRLDRVLSGDRDVFALPAGD
jgi:hypothetical protein